MRPLHPPPVGEPHRCCWVLPLRRGVVAIACFYCVYLFSVSLALLLYSGLTDDESVRVPMGVLGGVAALLTLLACALLAGAVLVRRALLLLWLVAYGAALATLTITGICLAIAGETGHDTFIKRFCHTHNRCSWRLFHYLFLLYAAEWYWWACVLLRYRQMVREARPEPEGQTPQPGTAVRGAHNGKVEHVPVVYAKM